MVKRYGEILALDGLDLRVEAGCCFGLLGPNGAGKTTTISVLTTLARPDAGAARLWGRDVVQERDRVRRDIGIVFQEPSLDLELTAWEHLDLQARLYRLPDRRVRVEAALEGVGLTDDAARPVRGFSGGMKRRLEIARGLLHRPRVLFLDEPTLGLDVAARASIWSRLRALHAAGDTTLFLTTHSMEEADALCQWIAILDRGRIVAEGAPDALKAELGGDVVQLVLERPGDVAARVESVAGVVRISMVPAGPEQTVGVEVTVADGPRRLASILDAVRPFGIREVRLHRPTLEDVFLHHTGHPFEPRPETGG